jgi:hypothetical protein
MYLAKCKVVGGPVSLETIELTSEPIVTITTSKEAVLQFTIVDPDL